METIEYRTIDKSTWGDGPWQNEPDQVDYVDPETGFACRIRRTPSIGSLCGYIGVPENHPCFSKGYDDVEVSVHGGLTYADSHHPGNKATVLETANIWWLGFDCAHCDDFAPGIYATLSKFPGDHSWMRDDAYRDITYVKSQIASLAKQLKALETQ